MGLREEWRKVGALVADVVRKAFVVADEVSAGDRGLLHVERGVGEPDLVTSYCELCEQSTVVEVWQWTTQ